MKIDVWAPVVALTVVIVVLIYGRVRGRRSSQLAHAQELEREAAYASHEALLARHDLERMQHDADHRALVRSNAMSLGTLAIWVTTSIAVVLGSLYLANSKADSDLSDQQTTTVEVYGGTDGSDATTNIPGIQVMAIVESVLAICDEGPDGSTHSSVWLSHRAAYPELWTAIDGLLPNGDPTSTECAVGLALEKERVQEVVESIPTEFRSAPSWLPLEDALRSLAAGNPAPDVQSIDRNAAAALVHLVLAVCDEGGDVQGHTKIAARHQGEYPDLWHALGQALPDGDPASSTCASDLNLTPASVQQIIAAIPTQTVQPAWPSLQDALNLLAEAAQ